LLRGADPDWVASTTELRYAAAAEAATVETRKARRLVFVIANLLKIRRWNHLCVLALPETDRNGRRTR
jgi:hypothetical protein